MKKYILSLLVIIVFTITSFGQAQIVITEIMYSPPAVQNQTGVEWLELYNNDTVDVDMTGYFFSEGITFAFPSITLNQGDFYLLTNDSVGFFQRYGLSARQFSGFMSNMGEDIALKDGSGLTVDSIDYEPNDPWPEIVNGGGPSLVLCAPDADNITPSNWQRAISPLGFTENGREIFGNPGSLVFCHGGPIVQIEVAELTFYEFPFSVTLDVVIDNENVNTTFVDIGITSITASTTTDVSFTPLTVSFLGSTNAPQQFTFNIISDAVLEPTEEFIITLSNPSNNALLGTDTLTVTILDNDGPVDKSLILTGIYDGSGMNSLQGVELYARENISDLSIFGLGSANNGGGTDAVEYSFPSVSVPEGTSLYVTNDLAQFSNFFGFAADFEDNNAIAFNGDDAFELFENGAVIDVFGDINMDGTGTPWEYSDGWAHRVDSTGPDCDVFVLANWTFSGINAFDGANTNSAASPPYPVGTFDYPSTMVAITPIGNLDYVNAFPNPTSDMITVSSNLRLDKISLTDLTGKEVLSVEDIENTSQMDLTNVSVGTYLLHATSGTHTWIKKIIVQ